MAEDKGDIASDKLVVEHGLEEARAEVKSYRELAKKLTPDEMDLFIEQMRKARERAAKLTDKLVALSTADRIAERLIDRLHRAIAGVHDLLAQKEELTVLSNLDPREHRDELREYFFALGGYVKVHPARTEGGHRWMDWHLMLEEKWYPADTLTPLPASDVGYHDLQLS